MVRDEFVVKTCYKNLAEVVYSIPIADVAPVVHGRWMHLGGDEWCCSACGFVVTTEGSWDKPAKKYCEDCGAKMDEEDKKQNDKDLLQALRRLKVETGSLACLGCGHEHNCDIHGCAIIREAAESIESLLMSGEENK